MIRIRMVARRSPSRRSMVRRSALNAVAVADGVVTLLSNGALLFRPNASFFGTTSFTYTASDGMGGVSDATITVTVAAAAATVNTGAALLSVTGVAAEHGVLVAVLGANPDGNGPAPSFQWYRDGQAIVGATGQRAHAYTGGHRFGSHRPSQLCRRQGQCRGCHQRVNSCRRCRK